MESGSNNNLGKNDLGKLVRKLAVGGAITVFSLPAFESVINYVGGFFGHDDVATYSEAQAGLFDWIPGVGKKKEEVKPQPAVEQLAPAVEQKADTMVSPEPKPEKKKTVAKKTTSYEPKALVLEEIVLPPNPTVKDKLVYAMKTHNRTVQKKLASGTGVQDVFGGIGRDVFNGDFKIAYTPKSTEIDNGTTLNSLFGVIGAANDKEKMVDIASYQFSKTLRLGDQAYADPSNFYFETDNKGNLVLYHTKIGLKRADGRQVTAPATYKNGQSRPDAGRVFIRKGEYTIQASTFNELAKGFGGEALEALAQGLDDYNMIDSLMNRLNASDITPEEADEIYGILSEKFGGLNNYIDVKDELAALKKRYEEIQAAKLEPEPVTKTVLDYVKPKRDTVIVTPDWKEKTADILIRYNMSVQLIQTLAKNGDLTTFDPTGFDTTHLITLTDLSRKDTVGYTFFGKSEEGLQDKDTTLDIFLVKPERTRDGKTVGLFNVDQKSDNPVTFSIEYLCVSNNWLGRGETYTFSPEFNPNYKEKNRDKFADHNIQLDGVWQIENGLWAKASARDVIKTFSQKNLTDNYMLWNKFENEFDIEALIGGDFGEKSAFSLGAGVGYSFDFKKTTDFNFDPDQVEEMVRKGVYFVAEMGSSPLVGEQAGNNTGIKLRFTGSPAQKEYLPELGEEFSDEISEVALQLYAVTPQLRGVNIRLLGDAGIYSERNKKTDKRVTTLNGKVGGEWQFLNYDKIAEWARGFSIVGYVSTNHDQHDQQGALGVNYKK